jgi:PAS domain S-box-containing protein
MRHGVRDFVPKSTDYLHYLPTAVERVLRAVRTERQLAVAEARFELFMNNMPTPAFIKDEQGRLLYANPSLQKILGRADWFGKTNHELWPESVADQLHASDQAALDGKDISQRTQTLQLPGGNVHQVVCSKFVMQDEDGRQLVGGIAVDVTEQRLAAEALRQKDEQLRQAQKMEAVGRLAGGIAHDFNNLLMVIMGYSDMLLANHQSLGERDEEYLHEIARAAGRAATLTRQLLAFSRKQVLDPRTIDLNAVLAGIETMLRRLIGEDIVFRTTLAPDIAKVWLDPGQLEQVIVNLVLNARDAMPQGGRLDIQTENVEVTADQAALCEGLKCGQYVKLSVTDNGCGIQEADKSRIFEPFFTTKAPGKGTGLGLSMVYGIVNQSGGAVAVESQVDRGTTFNVFFPALPVDATVACQSQVERAELRGTETVLLVEDEASVRSLTRIALQAYGYNVLEACDAQDAARISQTHRGKIDLIVTDVVMPQLGGPQLVELLRERRPEMKVIYVSGYTDDAVVRHGILHSSVNFLQKPFGPADLAAKIRSTLSAPNLHSLVKG